MEKAKLSMSTIHKIDDLIADFEKNIDWINYENIDDGQEVKIAGKLNAIYQNDDTADLLKTAKAFEQSNGGDDVKQGKLILAAMADLQKIACDDVPLS